MLPEDTHNWLIKPMLPENTCYLSPEKNFGDFPTRLIYFSLPRLFFFEKKSKANNFPSFLASHLSSFYSLDSIILTFSISTKLLTYLSSKTYSQLFSLSGEHNLFSCSWTVKKTESRSEWQKSHWRKKGEVTFGMFKMKLNF